MQISAERDALNREKGQLARQVNLLESLGRELQRQNLEEKARINFSSSIDFISFTICYSGTTDRGASG